MSNGLPMVVIPGLAADQPINAASAESWGVGKALPAGASAEAMRAAIETVLTNPAYAQAARAIARDLERVDGATNAADEIEDLLKSGARRAA